VAKASAKKPNAGVSSAAKATARKKPKPTIFDAIASGDAKRLERFLAREPEAVSARDGDGVSAVRRALYAGNPELAEVLVAAGAELDPFDAAALGDVDALKRAIGRRRSLVNALSEDGFTPLHLAAYFGGLDAARFLLERGADVHARSTNRSLPSLTPLQSAAAGRRTDVAALLLEHGADPNSTQAGGWTALHAAAANGNAELVRLLLKRGAKAGQLSDDRTPPIEFAIVNGHREVVALLRGRK
jgi:ankyrin repeat protein